MEPHSSFEKLKTSFLLTWNNLIAQVPNILAAVVIVALGILLSNLISKLFQKAVARRTHDPLMTNFLTKAVKTCLSLIVILFALNIAGLGGIAAGLLTAAGASAIVIGFAFKDIGENFISGVILSFNRPFNVNDTVGIGTIFGKIKSMEFRYTKLKTFDGRDVYIPNSDIIKNAVFNYTEDGFLRMDFVVGIAYEEVIEEAEALILSTLRSTDGVVEDDEHENFVVAEELAASTVNLRVYFWVKTIEYRKQSLKIKSDVVSNVKDAIVKNGMNMPADIQEIKLYGSQTSIPVVIKKEE